MIGIVDVIRAYSGVLETALGAPPVTKDLIEVRDRPCSYLQPGDCSRTREGSLLHDSIGLEIYYFAPYSDKGYLDLLEKRESLSNALLEPVYVASYCHVIPDVVNAELVRDEMILILRFSVEMVQEMDNSESTSDVLMQTLELDLEEED